MQTLLINCFLLLGALLHTEALTVVHGPAEAHGSQWGQFGPAGSVSAGVNIHFTRGHEKDLDMIAAAGFRFIRTDLVWQDIEYSKGSYDWSAYDELTENLEKRGLRALFILDYSNSLYEDTVTSKDPITAEVIRDIAAPAREESIRAFAIWARAAAIRYKDKKVVWEIWNEPNISFWRPEADVRAYVRLAKATCMEMRSAVPGCNIIGPATSQIPFPFLENVMESGLLEYLDAVSVHPYRDYSLAPETVGADYAKLREMIARSAPAGRKDIPVISSEWGYASCKGGLTPEKQAVNAVRMQLVNLLNGVPLSIWYDWKNDGESPTNFEHNCGTVTFDLKPKPAYNALSVLNSKLGGLTFSHRMETGSGDDYVLLFAGPGGVFRICAWTTGMPHDLKLELTVSGSPVINGYDGYGKDITVRSEVNGIVVTVGEMPQYIDLPCGVRFF